MLAVVWEVGQTWASWGRKPMSEVIRAVLLLIMFSVCANAHC